MISEIAGFSINAQTLGCAPLESANRRIDAMRNIDRTVVVTGSSSGIGLVPAPGDEFLLYKHARRFSSHSLPPLRQYIARDSWPVRKPLAGDS